METRTQNIHDYDRIERAIRFIASKTPGQYSLREVAQHVGLSEFHFQRLFARWAGITPKRFAQFLTLEHAKTLLRNSRSVFDASLRSGLSSPGRLHDLFVTVEAVTPGEYRAQGRGVEIRYGVHPSPFGDALIATTPRGICSIHFVSGAGGRSPRSAVEEIAAQWPGANLIDDAGASAEFATRIFSIETSHESLPLPVFLKGTNFQVNVWKALLRIPSGSAVTYEDLAELAGVPRAVRAVGTAVGRNPLIFLVPCHRVIRKTGEFGNYGGGIERKRAILAWESGRAGIFGAGKDDEHAAPETDAGANDSGMAYNAVRAIEGLAAAAGPTSTKG